MVSVSLEMKPFSGQVDLEKAAILIIDMQVSKRLEMCGNRHKTEGVPFEPSNSHNI